MPLSLVLPLILGILFLPRFIFASVAINEILFDPAGTDTGLEKIEIYNPDAAAVDLGGWELYPDGIGYFTFPSGFSLPSKSFAVIHLRASGTNDVQNLYHSSAASNMGNSSGSLALFRPGSRTKDTIVDFVRYHKAGAAERKTWESTAVEAGRWQAGTFVDITSLTEGNSIGLTSDGGSGSTSAWKIYATPTIGGANAGTTAAPPAAPLPPSPAPPPAPAGLAPPALRVVAGGDRIVLAGAVTPFRGQVFSHSGELVENARMLWNFGDGSFRDGRAVTHIYYFPGNYVVSLNGAVGEYTGSDYLTVTVLAPDLLITEIKLGADGFVELFNANDERLDLGGMSFTDERGAIFHINQGTLIGKGTAVSFPNVTTGLEPLPRLLLRDARGKTLDQVDFAGSLNSEESIERSGAAFVRVSPPTPGSYAARGRIAAAGAKTEIESEPAFSRTGPAAQSRTSSPEPPPIPSAPPRESAELSASATSRESARALAFTPQAFFAASVLLGLVAAGGFFLAKRRFSARE